MVNGHRDKEQSIMNIFLTAFSWLRNMQEAAAEEAAQTLLEYTLIIGVVVVLLWGALFLTGLPEAVEGSITALKNIFLNDVPAG
jgi:hypothetical protein